VFADGRTKHKDNLERLEKRQLYKSYWYLLSRIKK